MDKEDINTAEALFSEFDTLSEKFKHSALNCVASFTIATICLHAVLASNEKSTYLKQADAILEEIKQENCVTFPLHLSKTFP